MEKFSGESLRAMEMICFIGMTVGESEASSVCDARYLGPVCAGDIPAAISEFRPQVIGIVDGLFHLTAAVLHKDILYALSRGIIVYGAASIGALRAAELHRYGMIGVGQIYQRFVSGEWDGDDEVAVPCVYLKGRGWSVMPGFDALANIRATMDEAVRLDIVSSNVATSVIARAKKMCFIDRSWDHILNPESFPETALDIARLRRTVPEFRVDLKKMDALAMLRKMRDWAEDGRKAPGFTEYSIEPPCGPFWDEALFSRPLEVVSPIDRGIPGADDVPVLRDLLDFAVVADSEGARLFQDGLVRTLLCQLGRVLGIVPQSDEVAACRLKLVGEDDGGAGNLGPLDDIDIDELASEEVVCERVLEEVTLHVQRGLLLTLLVESNYVKAKERLLRIMQEARKQSSYGSGVDAQVLLEAHLLRLGVKSPEDHFARYLSWMPAHRLRYVVRMLLTESNGMQNDTSAGESV